MNKTDDKCAVCGASPFTYRVKEKLGMKFKNGYCPNNHVQTAETLDNAPANPFQYYPWGVPYEQI